jgi:hypothetical protein
VEKYSTAGKGTDDNIIQSMRFACWISKATNTHSEYSILAAFSWQNGYAQLFPCYVIRILLVLPQTRFNMTQNIVPHDIKDCDSSNYEVIRRFGEAFSIHIKKMAADFSKLFYSFQVRMAVFGLM